MLHMKRTWSHVWRISWTHFVSLYVFKNITWAKRVPPIFAKTVNSLLSSFWCSSSWSLWRSAGFTDKEHRAQGAYVILKFGLHHIILSSEWYDVEAAFSLLVKAWGKKETIYKCLNWVRYLIAGNTVKVGVRGPVLKSQYGMSLDSSVYQFSYL